MYNKFHEGTQPSRVFTPLILSISSAKNANKLLKEVFCLQFYFQRIGSIFISSEDIISEVRLMSRIIGRLGISSCTSSSESSCFLGKNWVDYFLKMSLTWSIFRLSAKFSFQTVQKSHHLIKNLPVKSVYKQSSPSYSPFGTDVLILLRKQPSPMSETISLRAIFQRKC